MCVCEADRVAPHGRCVSEEKVFEFEAPILGLRLYGMYGSLVYTEFFAVFSTATTRGIWRPSRVLIF